jgi:hypothetical protein
MKQILRTVLKVTMVSVLSAASITAAQPVHLIVPPGQPVPPSLDPVNVDVRTNSLIALFIRLEISGNNVTPHDMRLTRIPLGRADFSDDSSRIVIQAYNQNAELVGRTSVADRRMNARDGETVILDDRTVSIIVPLIGKAVEIAITIPNTGVQQRFSVAAIVQGYCSDFGAEPVCSSDPPRSSPHYDLLHPPRP